MSIRGLLGGQTAQCRTIDKVQVFNPHADISSVAAYDFEGNANDVLGSYNGTASNVTYAAGKYGQCAVSNGSTSVITTAYTPTTNIMSISGWFNSTAIATAQSIISCNNGSATAGGISIDTYTSQIRLTVSGASNWVLGTNIGSVLSSNTWYHFVFILDSTIVYFYLNGTLIYTSGAIAPKIATVPFTLLDTGNNPPLVGSLDQVRIFNKALTKAEVDYIYATDLTGIKQISAWDGCSVAAYDFENNANDLLGTYNGTATAITYAAGKYGNAGVFNGSTSKITIPNMNFTSLNYSVSVWAKFNSLADYPTVFQHYTGMMASINIESISGNMEIKVFDGGWKTINYTPVINTWYHIVLSVGSNTLKAYVNGTLVGTIAVGTLSNQAGGSYIGMYQDGVNYGMDGYIDQLRIFNRAITPTEVSYLYNNDLTAVKWMPWTTESGVALYRLDGNANDESGNYHGTETAITYGGGVYERGAMFNGTSSGIVSTSQYSITSTFTHSFWFKINILPTTTAQSLIGFSVSGCRTYINITTNNNKLTYVSAGNYYLTNFIPTVGTLYHITMVANGTTLYMYLNGTLYQTITIVAGSLSGYATLGVETGNIQFFNGMIDQVRIFNRAIIATEVATLYAECAPTSTVSVETNVLNQAVAHYKMDGNALDTTGNYNGTETAMTYADGRFGQAGVFNGTSSSILTTVNQSTQPIPFTYSVWVNTATASTGLLSNAVAGVNDATKIDTAGTGGRVRFASVGRIPEFQSTNPVTNSTWTHIAITWDGTTSANMVKMYINGVLDNSTTATSATTGYNSVFYIGRFGTNANYFTGSIDQVRIYNKALNATEITALYNETIPTSTVSTETNVLNQAVAHYKMDGNALDTTGNYNGTGTAVTYADGRFGQAGVFNGSANVDIGNQNSWMPTTSVPSRPITISLWANLTAYVATSSYMFCNHYQTGINFSGDSVGSSFSLGVIDSAGANKAVSTGVLALNTWYHLVLVYDGTNVVAYKDGVSLGTLATGGTLWNGAVGTTTRIGQRPNGTYGINGKIDQVRIYSKALNATEITTLYNETIPTSTVDSISPFNDSSLLNKCKLDGDTTSLVGTSPTVTGTVTYGTGKFGQCITGFSVGGSLTFSATGIKTVSMFIAPMTISGDRWIMDNRAVGGTEYFRLNSVGNYDFAGGLTVKRNGIPLTSGTAYPTAGIFEHISIELTTARNSVHIGNVNTNNDGNASNKIDQIELYNRVLTQQEVQTLCAEVQYPKVTLPTVELYPFLDNSCKALYKFDNNVLDSYEQYDGTATNVTYSAGKFGQCAVFNGTSSEVLATLPSLFTTNASFTTSVFLRKTIGTTGIPIKANGCVFYFSTATTLIVTALSSTNTNNTKSISHTFTDDNIMRLFTVTYDGVTIRLYRDAVLVASNSTENFQIGLAAGTLYIGRNSDGLQRFNGSLDQLRIFNKALTSQEVQAIYSESTYPKTTLPTVELDPFLDNSCKALYKFDNNVLDSYGQYDGTATNVTYGTGKFGQCAVFNGTSSKVAFTAISTAKAISFWTNKPLTNGTFSPFVGNATTAVYIGTGESSSAYTSETLAMYHASTTGSAYIRDVYNDSTWKHITVSYIANGNIKITVNGEYKTVYYVNTIGNLIAEFSMFGTYGNDAGGWFNGSIDQVRFFNKALTPMEVASLYNETTPLEEPMHSLVDPFKDGSGKALYRLDGNALDESGDYNGTATSVTYGAGRFGRCAIFSTSKIATTATIGANTSISFWAYRTSTGDSAINGNSGTQYILGNLAVWVSNGSNCFSASTVMLPVTSTWYHIVIVDNGSSVKGYRNGVELTNLTGTYNAITQTLSNIGTYAPLATHNFGGYIEQLRIFNRALTAGEVQTLYTEI